LTIERTDFMSVPVQDMERAKRFYSETLGIHSPNLDDGWPEFETGKRAKLEEAGVEFFGEIRDTGVCHMAFFQDTEGNALMLHRRYAP
jgi:predicted enzyme related to lactoylglutathione lyase